MHYRIGNSDDIPQMLELGIVSWVEYQNQLTPPYAAELLQNLQSETTYQDLIDSAECILCENKEGELIGMAFLVPKGNPTDIYDEKWCYIRFVSVHPEYRGMGMGKELTLKCIALAQQNKEQTIALHTSEIMHQARALYENLGFKVYREIPPRLGIKYWLYMLQLQNQ